MTSLLPRLILLAGMGLLPALSAENYYKRDAVFAYRPSATSSKQEIKRFGPVGIAIELHQPAFVMKVGAVEEGSPAETAGLKKGQIIESINGETLADIDPRVQLGNMITKAEANGGLVRFMIKDRADTPARPVVVQIPALGPYSPTWPLDCAKSDAIVRGYADYLARKEWNGGIALNGAEILFLLSTGEEKDLAVVRERMKQIVAYHTKAAPPTYSWHIGYGGIPLAEYYLRTGDPTVFPIIEKFVQGAVENYYNGGWGGRGYGGYTYGQMNAGGTHVVTFLLLAKECGVSGHEGIMIRALRQQFRFSGRGCTPYGDHLPNPAFIDNGKTAVLAFTMAAAASLTPNGEDSIYAQARDLCASKGFYSTSYMNVGHTGGGIGEVWRGAAIGLLPEVRPTQYRELLDARSYFLDASRRFNGSFGILGGGGYDKNDSWPSPVMGLTYTAPRKTLQITGAPNTPHSKPYPLPKQLWGTAADNVFQSLSPVAGAQGKAPDLGAETFYKDAAAPAMVRMGVPRNAYSHTLAQPAVPPTAATYDHYAHHPEYGLRHYAAQRIQATGQFQLIQTYLDAEDPRLRAVGTQCIVWNGKSRMPTEHLTDAMVQSLLRMINDPKESWWVVQSALTALTIAPQDALLPHTDRLLELAQHEEWWIQTAALKTLEPLIAMEAVAGKIFPTLYTVLVTNQRNTPVGPIAALSQKAAQASPAIQQTAVAHFAKAYRDHPVAGNEPRDPQHPQGEEELLSKIAHHLAHFPGGLDALYAEATARYPNEALPHRTIFLSPSDYASNPKTQQALKPTIVEQLIPEYIGSNTTRLLDAAKMKQQSTFPGRDPRDQTGHEVIDGLVSLHRKIGTHDYDWRLFVDLRDAEWQYHSFDPIPEEQVNWDQLITRYRDVTLPAGMEDWTAVDFDAKAAGWKTGRAPFGNYNGKLPAGPLPKCNANCTGPGCYGAAPCNTLWEKEVLLFRGTFDIPAVKEGHRYRLRVNDGEHVGLGGGFQVFINGRELVEQKSGNGRGSNGRVKGGYITQEFLNEFQGEPVTIAVKSFIRYNDRYKAKPSSKLPQGRISVHLEEMKLPTVGAEEILKSASVTPMTCIEWQQNPTNDTMHVWGGEFDPNPAFLGDWTVVSEVQEPGELDPVKPRKARNPPFTKLSLKNDARTDQLLWAWSGDHLFNLSKNEALRMTARDVDGKTFLFVERGEFSTRRPPAWKPTLLVLARTP